MTPEQRDCIIQQFEQGAKIAYLPSLLSSRRFVRAGEGLLEVFWGTSLDQKGQAFGHSLIGEMLGLTQLGRRSHQ